MEKIPKNKRLYTYLCTESRWKHKKQDGYNTEIIQMRKDMKNAGNKLKQIRRKLKQDAIRLSREVTLQRRMSEGTRLVAQRHRLMGCGRTRKKTLTE
jgi:hypothetical protein